MINQSPKNAKRYIKFPKGLGKFLKDEGTISWHSIFRVDQGD